MVDVFSVSAEDVSIETDYDFDIDTPDIITQKFPFCLPFDLYNIVTIFVEDPVAPFFEIPLKMEGVFDYSISIDLSEYNHIAEIIRWFIYIVFVVGLIIITNNLLGRG